MELALQRPITWNGIVLLYGPPGTGKTSLCGALAQRLSIRLKPIFPNTKLIEIESSSLYSKYFSESAKLVKKTFQAVRQLLDREPDIFVVISIDEIESLAGCRDRSLNGNEPQDAMRVNHT